MIRKLVVSFFFSLFLLIPGISHAQAVLPFPAPTLLAPTADVKLGQDRTWVGGVAKNNSLVKILIDGQAQASIQVKNHLSGTASFGVKINGLTLGSHTVTATATDPKGKTSAVSNALVLNILASTPAPTLDKPVVNADAGIERPFIVGHIQNGLDVSIVINGRIVKTLMPAPHASGITSFSWQPETALALGQQKIEAFAADNGKLSNNSKPVFWQVGEKPKSVSMTEPVEPKTSLKIETKKEPIVKATTSPESLPLTVTEKEGDGKISSVDSQGKINESTTSPATIAKTDSQTTEVSPGAVVKNTAADNESGGGFKFNSSLIVGITILVFLLLSMLVWYIQEKRDALGDKVAGLFRETPEIGFKVDKLPGDMRATGKNDVGRKPTDLPPPPPPVF